MGEGSRAAVLAGLIGKPYRDRGRGPDAFDCWGLVAHVRPKLFGGPALPDADIGAAEVRKVARAFTDPRNRTGWAALPVPRPFAAPDGAIVMMARGDIPHHVGLWLQPEGAMLHCCSAQRVVMDRPGHLAAAYWRITTILVPEPVAGP